MARNGGLTARVDSTSETRIVGNFYDAEVTTCAKIHVIIAIKAK
jgi:hypothetical protein